MRRHVVEYITGELLQKAREAYKTENYRKVIYIGATQYPYNVCGACIYYNLPKSDTYDKIQNLSKIALECNIPEKTRASMIIFELIDLSNYYKNTLKQEVIASWNLKNIKD